MRLEKNSLTIEGIENLGGNLAFIFSYEVEGEKGIREYILSENGLKNNLNLEGKVNYIEGNEVVTVEDNGKVTSIELENIIELVEKILRTR